MGNQLVSSTKFSILIKFIGLAKKKKNGISNIENKSGISQSHEIRISKIVILLGSFRHFMNAIRRVFKIKKGENVDFLFFLIHLGR